MTGTLRSLRDWLADQVAEVRHAMPLAVLAPQEGTTRWVSTDTALAPKLHQPPVCQVVADGRKCDRPASYALRLSHAGQGTCGSPRVFLACHGCRAFTVSVAKRSAPCRCAHCGNRVPTWTDYVVSEVRL